MNRRLTLLPLLFATLAACTQFPELEYTQTDAIEAADYPALVPIEPILVTVEVPKTDPVRTEAALNARLAALRARANRLRGAGLTGQERQRLEQGLS